MAAVAETEQLSKDEAAELEKLLAEEGGAVPAAGPPAGAGKFGALVYKAREFLRTRKKLVIIVGVALLSILLLVGVSLFFFKSLGKKEVVQEEVKTETKAEEEEAAQEIEYVHIYEMAPFFIPYVSEDGETEEFVKVTINLSMSTAKLRGEVDQHLMNIRQRIYALLKSRKLIDLKHAHAKAIEEELNIIKKDVKNTINSLLIRGTGTIKDVALSNFILRG